MKKEDQQVMVITPFKTTILLGIYLSIFGQIEAQIITDRPDQTESSYSVGNGNLQLETGVLISLSLIHIPSPRDS